MGGMKGESRRPRGHAGEFNERVVCEIVALKGAHRHWGPKKIRELYRRKHGEPVPSENSFKRVLERAGMTEKRRPRIKMEKGRLTSDRQATRPNEIWSVDFKGWWRDRSGLRVEPPTVRDEYSRLILEIRALENARSETVRRCFERLFEKYGMPEPAQHKTTRSHVHRAGSSMAAITMCSR
jgi:transposase InsO family protein